MTAIDPATDASLVARVLAGDRRAESALIRAYDGLCRSVAFPWAKTAADLDDLMQECRIALVGCLPTWDAVKGPLSAYATWAMRHAIRSARLDLRTVYLPSWIAEALDKSNAHGVDRTVAGLKSVGLVKPGSGVDDSCLVGRGVSTDVKVGDESLAGALRSVRLMFGDMLSDPDARSPHDETADREMMARVWKVAMEKLTTREMDVFRRRMNGDTLQEIGNDCGVSRAAIGQTEQKAHAKIRRWVRV